MEAIDGLSTLHKWNIGILKQSACRHPHTHFGCAHGHGHTQDVHMHGHTQDVHIHGHTCKLTCTYPHIHMYIHLCTGVHSGGRTEVYRPALNGLSVNTLQTVTALSSIEEDGDAVKYEVRHVSCEELCSLPSSSRLFLRAVDV